MKRGTSFASIVSGLVVVAGAVCGASTAAAEEAPDTAPGVVASSPASAATPAPQGMVDAPLPAAVSAPAPPREWGLVLELSTGGLSGGALGIGAGMRSMAVGVGVDYRYASLASEQTSAFGKTEQTQSTLAIGPWLRVELLRTQDDRVALFGALDIQYGRQFSSSRLETSSEKERASADGFILRLGPGLRYWATRWLALGYSSQLVVTSLTGPLLAFTPSTALGSSSSSFGRLEVGLAGRFTVLAIF
jgi:hypothetical protein